MNPEVSHTPRGGCGQPVVPDCPEPFIDGEHGGKAQPTLRNILLFKSNARTINLAQQIGIRGKDVGVHLLEDDSGAIVESIAAESRSIENTNREILMKWLQGSGAKPVAWSTLTNAMRKVELYDLAAEVDEATNAEETKVPSLIPSHPEDVDGVDDDPVPEGTTVLCTVKAEKTQYPHGSRQDCWAIVSVKALRIEKRQHVDIVAVIDSSGSMAGMKTQLVKETLIRLIDLLDEKDRIALLTYNTSVKQHFGLQEATSENKQIFKNAISSIVAEGRTNLCDGLMKGIEMLTYNGGTKPAPVQSVLLFSDGEATEGVTVCSKILKEMDQVKCYSGSVYTFAFGNDCDYEMMKDIASHSKGVCYFIDSLEKIAPSFGDCLGGLKTTVAQNLSLHIEMQEDNRINTVHCHDAVQWLVEDKICDLFIKDIQCGEQKCVALTLILPRLMKKKSDTVLKGTLSFIETGSSENKLQDFQLHLMRADGCCNDDSNYQVDQQRNRILVIEAMNNLKKSGNYNKARNHMSELITSIKGSVSHSSPWTQNLISDLKNCLASFPEPAQDKQRRKHHKSMSSKRFPPKLSHSLSHPEETNILLDPRAYDLSEDDMPSHFGYQRQAGSVEAHSLILDYCSSETSRHTCSEEMSLGRVSMTKGDKMEEDDEPPEEMLTMKMATNEIGKEMEDKNKHMEELPTITPESYETHAACAQMKPKARLSHSKSSKAIFTYSQHGRQAGVGSSEGLNRAGVGTAGDQGWSSMCFSKCVEKSARKKSCHFSSKKSAVEKSCGFSSKSDFNEENPSSQIEPASCSSKTRLLSQSKSDPSHDVHCAVASGSDITFTNQSRVVLHSKSDPSHYETKSSTSDSEYSEDSNEDQFLQSSGALALNSMLHALTEQRSNRVGACMFRTEAKDEMQRKFRK